MSIKSTAKRTACVIAASLVLSVCSVQTGVVSSDDVFNAISITAEATSNTYYPACASKYTSIVDALKSIGVNSSYSNRKTIAVLNGISNYSGTAA